MDRTNIQPAIDVWGHIETLVCAGIGSALLSTTTENVSGTYMSSELCAQKEAHAQRALIPGNKSSNSYCNDKKSELANLKWPSLDACNRVI